VPAPGAGAALRLEVSTLPPGERIVVDGKAREALWQRAPETRVPAGGKTVRLRAFRDAERIYLLTMWEDGAVDRNRVWKLGDGKRWERRRGEDGLSIAWAPGGLAAAFREQGCTLFCHEGAHRRDEGEGVLDVWYWGAQRTNPLFQADDLALRFGPEQTLRGDGQPAEAGNLLNESVEFHGPGWCPVRPNAATPRELFVRNAQRLPRERLLALSSTEGWEIPYDLLREFGGSRGDVAARGDHYGGVWTVEWSRRLATGHPDDEPLGDPLVPSWLALALQDGTEGGEHLLSPPVEVRFLPTP